MLPSRCRMETPTKCNLRNESQLFKTPKNRRTPPQSPSRSVCKTLDSSTSSVDSIDLWYGIDLRKYSKKKRRHRDTEKKIFTSNHHKDSHSAENPIKTMEGNSRQPNQRNVHKKMILAILLLFMVVAAAYLWWSSTMQLFLRNNEVQPLTPLESRRLMFESHQKQLVELTRTHVELSRIVMRLSQEVRFLRAKMNSTECSPMVVHSRGVLEELLSGEADLAYEGSGCSVVSTPDTQTLTITHQINIFGGLHSFKKNWPHNPPETTIKGMIQGPGDCWGFQGNTGRLILRLNQPCQLKSVSISHLPRSLSHSSSFLSAPKKFKFLAHITPDDNGVVLGEFMYMQFGPWRQTFELEPVIQNEIVQVVEFQFISNYGHPNFTCIYRVHVHGDFFT